ncbi:hypothetical protein V6S67_17985 [Arthrobacter sp. Soc17.1.1.1]|uniref:hypothetical protein n=1 Tax=Arthrobacter sp. Soc17.1.1.1 TaxID=3121277 RepID=UPI002FE4CC5E
MNSRLFPTDSFPEDLTALEDIELQVLHSRVQRQVDYEYAHDIEVNPETDFRAADIAEEFERREALTSPWRSLLHPMFQA